MVGWGVRRQRGRSNEGVENRGIFPWGKLVRVWSEAGHPGLQGTQASLPPRDLAPKGRLRAVRAELKGDARTMRPARQVRSALPWTLRATRISRAVCKGQGLCARVASSGYKVSPRAPGRHHALHQHKRIFASWLRTSGLTSARDGPQLLLPCW